MEDAMTPYENEIEQLLTKAEELLQDEKPDEAMSLLERARKLEPRHAWTMLFRGVALGQLGHVEEAVEQFLAAADENIADIDIQVDAARHLSLLEQYQDAIICAERAVALDESDAGGQAVYGEILERLGRIEEAVPYREHALSLDAEDVDSRYYLAVDLCDLGRYQEASQVSQPLVDNFGDDPDIIRLHGACLSYSGFHQDALACWAELERIEGITPNLLHNRASTLDVIGLREEALATIDEAIELEPDLALNYYTRGMINEHHGDDAAAIEDYLAAMTRDPEHLDAIINLVELAVTVDVVAAVLERIDHLLAISENTAKLLYARGRLLMELDDLPQGKSAIEQAVQREPSLSVAWFALTMLYGMEGDLEASVTASGQALRYFDDDSGLWLNRGLALHDLKRYPEALECYDRAAQLALEDPVPWLQIGRMMLLDLGRPADARGALKEVLRLQPENQSASWMLALCCLRLTRTEEAERELGKLLADDPDYLWGRLVRAAFHAQKSSVEDALQDLAVVVAQGYDVRLLLNEPLFKPLWKESRFKTLVGKK